MYERCSEARLKGREKSLPSFFVLINKDLSNNVVKKARTYYPAAGETLSIPLASNGGIYFAMSGSNVSSICTIVFCAASSLILRPLVTEGGFQLTSTGLTLNVKNNTQYGAIPFFMLKLA